ncbi:uncharacterized protein PGTG_09185 [Puccinia graminis f. sp. tritici CRL 75-36-700-3]|uniref:No apical meristem-associated C-terminal domain-containing protein n=1 Tax=Puccinia graminis f. sp. tritici (strain CRL 75-36-700-3 / race SCCL) TaxID=418459 RepID=E3KFU7_PUCGT|nr:uncharacterized protein PGTG_09185 [Puccinia graminis f. sp. tritici CRL 75-36-700-3]EFP83232.2 hypothetical protein PGTG_09185 [Puccinia graminis f. sp. tritici CRL 75-36-700-3]
MNTATLKFSAIYNAIERNPPSGSSPNDWLEAAKMNYLDQTKGTAFSNLPAWQKLQYAPKWRADPRVDQPATPLPTTLSDSIDPESAHDENPGMSSPTVCSASSISCPIGGKAAKKRRIEGYQHEELLSQTSDLAVISQERLTAFHKGNEILIDKNNIMKEKIEIERKKLQLEQEKLAVEKEYCQSKTDMNDFKILRDAEDLGDEEAKDVIKIIKDQIKNKWRARAGL